MKPHGSNPRFQAEARQAAATLDRAERHEERRARRAAPELHGPVDVRLELHPEAILSRVWIDGEEWIGSVKRLSVDVDDTGATILTLSVHARVTAEGIVPLRRPIEMSTDV